MSIIFLVNTEILVFGGPATSLPPPPASSSSKVSLFKLKMIEIDVVRKSDE